MPSYEDLDYASYAYEASLESAPYISVNMNTYTLEEIEEEANAYYNPETHEGTAVDYRNSIAKKLEKRASVRSRFEKDLMACMVAGNDAMGVIDLVNNTYVANKKADELFTEASRNLALYRESGCRNTGTNCKRLFDSLFVNDGGTGLVYTETESAVPYDDEAILGMNGEVFILKNPSSEETRRVWYSYELENSEYVPKFTVRHVDSLWIYAPVTVEGATIVVGDAIYVAENIDANTIVWFPVPENSSSSQE